ncbi:MAG TPA: TIGR03560 family F420-dependent LLM class oxidoreductase [Candidatus Limnocylindria bacterium]|nr:TIGR03560 family F420-dependent LLM class oxidoreductase [Candidatus Limnocylindria bacterium]
MSARTLRVNGRTVEADMAPSDTPQVGEEPRGVAGIRVGLKLSQQVFSLPAQREAWRIVDEAGFDHLWLFDHLVAIHQETPAPIYDGWTLLAAVAETTKRVRIGLNVTGNLYRHPGLLAKIAVTVDHLSGGRLEMGLGAGWNEPEFSMYGMPFPVRPEERIDRLDEACWVLKALWTEPRATFAGRYYQLKDAIAEPKPVQRPYPPIWIGGNGRKRTLRVAATHGDVWSCDVWPTDASAIEPAYDLGKVLDGHCAAIGRDPKTIRRAHMLLADGTDTPLEIARHSVRAGFTDFLLFPVLALSPQADIRAAIEAAAALLPRLRKLG